MRVLYILFLLDTLNLAVYLPVFSAFVRSLGGTPFTLGLINSSSALITLFWNPIVGSLSDQVGRKGLLMKCMVASCVGSLVMAFSSSSLTLVFLGRLIGAFGSPISILLRSTVADIFESDEDKKLFLNKSAPLISLGFLVGSLSSGFLSEAKNGYLLAFSLMASIMALATLITIQSIPEDDKPKTLSKKQVHLLQKVIQELKTAAINIKSISWPRYKDLFIMKGLYDFSLTIIISNIGLVLLDEFGLIGRHLGYVFFMTSLFSIISNILKLKLHDFFANMPDERKIITAGLILLICFIGMTISFSVYVFVLFIAILCFSKTFMDVFWMEMLTIKTLEDDRGKVFAAFDNLFPFMSIIVPILSGLVLDKFGVRFLLLSASLPISLLIYLAYKKTNDEKIIHLKMK